MLKHLISFCLKSISLTLIYNIGLHAAINLNGTRYIYEQNEKEIDVKVNNEGDYPVLLQSWIDDGHPETLPEKLNVPFVLTPPLTRVEPNHGQTIRIRYTGSMLALDKESIFWLNVLEIPPSSKNLKNQLQVAFRNRVKLFFRPSNLKLSPTEALNKIKWKNSNGNLEITNPTPYYFSLTGVKITTNKHEAIIPGKMIPPGGVGLYELQNKNVNFNNSTIVEIIYINDYGTERKTKIASTYE